MLACLDGETALTRDVAQQMGVAADYAQQYRKRFMNAGIIAAAGQGKVAFAMPLLADYLKNTGEE